MMGEVKATFSFWLVAVVIVEFAVLAAESAVVADAFDGSVGDSFQRSIGFVPSDSLLFDCIDTLPATRLPSLDPFSSSLDKRSSSHSLTRRVSISCCC